MTVFPAPIFSPSGAFPTASQISDTTNQTLRLEGLPNYPRETSFLYGPLRRVDLLFVQEIARVRLVYVSRFSVKRPAYLHSRAVSLLVVWV